MAQILNLMGSRENNFDSISINARLTTESEIAMTSPNGPNGMPGNLSISAVLGLWYNMSRIVSEIVAPVGQMSIFVPSIAANNLSYLRLAYYSKFLSFCLISQVL